MGSCYGGLTTCNASLLHKQVVKKAEEASGLRTPCILTIGANGSVRCEGG